MPVHLPKGNSSILPKSNISGVHLANTFRLHKGQVPAEEHMSLVLCLFHAAQGAFFVCYFLLPLSKRSLLELLSHRCRAATADDGCQASSIPHMIYTFDRSTEESSLMKASEMGRPFQFCGIWFSAPEAPTAPALQQCPGTLQLKNLERE